MDHGLYGYAVFWAPMCVASDCEALHGNYLGTPEDVVGWPSLQLQLSPTEFPFYGPVCCMGYHKGQYM